MAELPSETWTFLFTDIEGSTRLWEAHATAMRDALARHDDVVRDAVESHDGSIVKTTGDGFHAVFPTAAAAVAAAVASQRSLAVVSWGDVGPLRVRMGIDTGAAQARDGDFYGPVVNRAARLMSVAHGGQIVVSAASRGLLDETDFDLVDLGAHRLRDLASPVRVFQVVIAGLPCEFPPLRSSEGIPGNLPVQRSSFVGRQAELAELRATVVASRLVTLVGVGGVGKTRLAIELGTELGTELVTDFSDGVWLCELAGADDKASMHQLIAATLGVASRPGLDVCGSVVEFLTPKELLLVLDNCEHVIDSAAEITNLILTNCPHVRVLATSREALALDGERILRVGSLSLPDDPREWSTSEAVQLFVARAVDARPGFAVDDANVAGVLEVCRRLDGMPLALELAAARVATMTPVEIAGHLDERFRLLAGRRRAAVERHQTLRATVEWSYSLLDEVERRAFDRLGVFAGTFTAEAAIAVAGEDLESWDVLDALSGLAAKSMLIAEGTSDGRTRYRMLETMRHYARERLASTADPDESRDRHAQYYAELADAIGQALLGSDELRWRRRLALELDDLRAAVNWSLDQPGDDRCLRIVAALSVQAAQYDASGIGLWALPCLERAQQAPAGLRTAVLATAAWETWRTAGGATLAFRLAEDALRDGLPPGWPSSYLPHLTLASARALAVLDGDLMDLSDQVEAAEATARSGHEALDAAGVSRVGHTNLWAAQSVWASDPRLALEYGEAALDNARATGNPTALAVGWWAIGMACSLTDPARALAALETCFALIRDGAGDGVYPAGLVVAAGIAARLGETDRVPGYLREALLWARDTGNHPAGTTAVFVATGVFLDQGHLVVASTLAGAIEGPLALIAPVAPVLETLLVLERLESLSPLLVADDLAAAHQRGMSMSYDEVIEYLLDQVDSVPTV